MLCLVLSINLPCFHPVIPWLFNCFISSFIHLFYLTLLLPHSFTYLLRFFHPLFFSICLLLFSSRYCLTACHLCLFFPFASWLFSPSHFIGYLCCCCSALTHDRSSFSLHSVLLPELLFHFLFTTLPCLLLFSSFFLLFFLNPLNVGLNSWPWDRIWLEIKNWTPRDAWVA